MVGRWSENDITNKKHTEKIQKGNGPELALVTIITTLS